MVEAEIDELREIREQMIAAVGTGAIMACSRLNSRLHRRRVEMSGQGTAEGTIERSRGQSVRHQFRVAMRPGRPPVSPPERLAIIDAICSRGPVAAQQAARSHLGSVIQALRGASAPTALA